jgi:hypothetical protein
MSALLDRTCQLVLMLSKSLRWIQANALIEAHCGSQFGFPAVGRQPGQNRIFVRITSGYPVIRPQLARTSRMTCESVSMSGLAISLTE